jgi:hypothetical protein
MREKERVLKRRRHRREETLKGKVREAVLNAKKEPAPKKK